MTMGADALTTPLAETVTTGFSFRAWRTQRSKTLLLFASAFTFGLTWLVAVALGVPAQPGFDASLLVQRSALSAIAALVVSVLINTGVLRAALGRTMWLEVGFAVAVGLLAFSARGGSTVDLLQYHGVGIHSVLIIETLLIFAVLAGVWRWLRPAADVVDGESSSDLQSKLTALAVTAVVMIFALHLLCQTPAKKQVIAAVAVSALAGATVAFSFLGEMSVEPYLLAPCVVAIAGYALALFGGTSPLGQPTQVLAFPLPTDYAGAGVAGVLLGYWTGLGWKQENERDAA